MIRSDDPPQEPKKKKSKVAAIRIDTVTTSERMPDSLYIMQMELKAELDSLLKEKKKKIKQ